MINWHIADYCFKAESNGHRFELGEMGRDYWILKHWHKSPRSDWYTVTSASEGKAMAETLAREGV